MEDMTLASWCNEGPFTLAMSCSFFGYFAHCGVLAALLERGLAPARVAGSSGGAVVAALHAVGHTPATMLPLFSELEFSDIFEFRPTLYWGFPWVGLFRQRFDALEERLLSSHGLPTRLEDAPLPCALSVYDVDAKRLRIVRTGRVAAAVAGSASVPVLMHAADVAAADAPAAVGGDAAAVDAAGVEVVVSGDEGGTAAPPTVFRCSDAGVSGDVLGVGGCAPDERVLNANLFLRAFVPPTPAHLPRCVTLDVYGVPFVMPNRLAEQGALAYASARAATAAALDRPVPRSTVGGARRMSVVARQPQAAAADGAAVAAASAPLCVPPPEVASRSAAEPMAEPVATTQQRPAGVLDLFRS